MPWSLWYFWEDDGSFAGHYVNLELVHHRPTSGEARVLTRDLTLDLWLDADGRTVMTPGSGSRTRTSWPRSPRAGRFTPEQADALLALADRARTDLVEARALAAGRGLGVLAAPRPTSTDP